MGVKERDAYIMLVKPIKVFVALHSIVSVSVHAVYNKRNPNVMNHYRSCLIGFIPKYKRYMHVFF